MARVKSSETPHYEMLYIVSNKYTEDELKPIQESAHKLIEENGGKITYQEDWGKKKFAYKIDHFTHGYYSLVEFDMPGKSMHNVNNLFRMSNEILRHMIVNVPSRTEAEIKKQKEEDEKRYMDTLKKEKGIESPRESASKAKTEIKKDKEEKKKEKVDLKELDKKLDKILDTDDLI